MRWVVIAAALFLAAAAQAAVAPLFPLGSTTAIIGLPLLGAIFLYAGRTPALVALPLLAVAEAWTRGIEPGVLLISFAPLPLLLSFFEARSHSGISGPAFVAALAATGAWARLTSLLAIRAQGGEIPQLAYVFEVLVPGAILDTIVAATAYGACRVLIGEPGRARRYGRRVLQ